MRMSRCSPKRRASPPIAPPCRRPSRRICAARRNSPTPRPPPRSGSDSSAAAKGWPRSPPCCWDLEELSVHGRRADAWTRAALQPPRAHGAPLPPAELKASPEDFHVEERLSFEPSDAGPHWLLRVEKRTANTRWVAAEIARLAGVPARDVGYAVLKDRHAVAVQWFSVPNLGMSAESWTDVRTAEFRVLEARANLRKLRRGALSGNRFRIRLRNATWSREQLDLKLDALRAHGAPNYFGPQRFGRDGYNLDRVAAWVQNGVAPRGRAERSFALSAARSLVFNALLARRLEAGGWW